jgi:hypothetical protein
LLGVHGGLKQIPDACVAIQGPILIGIAIPSDLYNPKKLVLSQLPCTLIITSHSVSMVVVHWQLSTWFLNTEQSRGIGALDDLGG